MIQYVIRKLTDNQIPAESGIKQLFGIPAPLNEAPINHFPWDVNGYRPQSGAFVGWDDTGLHVWLYALETDLRAEVTAFCGRVCSDSCLEFFFQPDPDHSDLYVNYECSPRPCVYLATGASGHNRKEPASLPSGLEPVSAIVPGHGWCVRYTVTSSWLREAFGVQLTSGYKMRGNFFKCGNLTAHPHYGVWSPIDVQVHPKPDFHLSEYFSELLLE